MALTNLQKAILITAGVAAVVVAGVLIYNHYRLSTSGIIATVGISVYDDVGLTKPLTAINWGIVYPGTNQTHTCWIKYTGNVNASLAFSQENFNPAGANVIKLYTDFVPGTLVKPGDVVKVVLKISTPADIQGITNFSFDIVISVYNL